MAYAPVSTIRVLLVDDNQDYLDALSRLLATYPCIGGTPQALSATEAITEIAACRPDLMLVDIALPSGANGLELTRGIKSRPDSPKIIIVTLYDTPGYRDAAKAAGADGFLGKSQLGDRLQGLIRELFPGVCREARPDRQAE